MIVLGFESILLNAVKKNKKTQLKIDEPTYFCNKAMAKLNENGSLFTFEAFSIQMSSRVLPFQ